MSEAICFNFLITIIYLQINYDEDNYKSTTEIGTEEREKGRARDATHLEPQVCFYVFNVFLTHS